MSRQQISRIDKTIRYIPAFAAFFNGATTAESGDTAHQAALVTTTLALLLLGRLLLVLHLLLRIALRRVLTLRGVLALRRSVGLKERESVTR